MQRQLAAINQHPEVAGNNTPTLGDHTLTCGETAGE